MTPQLPQPGERVVVAMSGGVDSSVVAALLAERGCEVVGITLSLYEGAADDSFEGGCCTPEDISDARRVCADLGAPHYVLNYRDAFKSSVIDPFVNSWKAGITPNPCVECNSVLKFRRLMKRVQDLDARWLATGHYARLEQTQSGETKLLAGRDRSKDQSYFLYGVEAPVLPRLTFPLGDMDKQLVRSEGRRLGVRTTEKPDSQDVCFIPDGRTADFVARSGGAGEPGAIVDEGGRVLGEHQGVHSYTVGQRKGLGIASSEPLYVTRIDAARRRLVVAGSERLEAARIVAGRWNWLRRPRAGETLRAKARYRSRGSKVGGIQEVGDRVLLDLEEPARAVAPGQAAVLYGGAEGDEVLGGGTIVLPD